MCVESKKAKLTEREKRMVVARGWVVVKLGEGGQKIQTSSYKVNEFWGFDIQHGDHG